MQQSVSMNQNIMTTYRTKIIQIYMNTNNIGLLLIISLILIIRELFYYFHYYYYFIFLSAVFQTYGFPKFCIDLSFTFQIELFIFEFKKTIIYCNKYKHIPHSRKQITGRIFFEANFQRLQLISYYYNSFNRLGLHTK